MKEATLKKCEVGISADANLNIVFDNTDEALEPVSNSSNAHANMNIFVNT
jgi:hypothetical protein